MIGPSRDETEDAAGYRAAMALAGWSDSEIEAMQQAHKVREDSAPVTSPGVNRHVEAAFGQLADDVEAAMDRLGYKSQARVARGIEPRVGPLAAKTGVIMTDESIVTIGSFLFRFCGLIAWAFTRTLRLNPWIWEPDDYAEAEAMALMQSSPETLKYWMNIYFSFAMIGTQIGVPFWPSTKQEVLLMEQVARAMEIFAVAHEYGHHHLCHGRDIEGDPKAQEFEADQFALRVSEEVDRRPMILENPYLISGAGGAILLMALETLRAVEELTGASAPPRETHPPVSDRIARFNSTHILQPAEFKWLQGFRIASTRIMALVHEALVPALASLSPTQLADIAKLRDQMRAPR